MNTNHLSILTISPIRLSSMGRKHPLEVKVTWPLTGNNLPVLLFAHGFGSSMDAYTPLVNYWAAHGFVVIQPTFLDSTNFATEHHPSHAEAVQAFLNDPETKNIWRQRITDLSAVLDQLSSVEDAVPGLKGRINTSQIAAAGHSFGAHTVATLLGAQTILPGGAAVEGLRDERIKAGILLSAAGRGGDALSKFATEHFPYLNIDYSSMTTRTLIVAGDQDRSPLTVLGPEWFTDAYRLSPGADALLTLFGGEHMLGGISGYKVRETTDENPERVSMVQLVTLAYLQRSLSDDATLWEDVCSSLSVSASTAGSIETK